MVMIIKSFGWRAMYLTMRCSGAAIALACAIFIKNPLPVKPNMVVLKEVEDLKTVEDIIDP